ncbi:MAG: DUF1761 domain-containing protein [Pseudomonadota bacterium]
MLGGISPIGFILAIIASMVIGAVWYTVLSGPWIKANGFDESEIAKAQSGGGASIYGTAALSHAIMALVLSALLYQTQANSLAGGLTLAFLCWLGFVITTMSVNHRFQMKPWSLTIIDAGHFLLVLLAQGALLGAFSGAA